MRGARREISEGDRFGRRTVIGELGMDGSGHRYFKVRCDCGLLWIHRMDRLVAVADGRPCRFCSSQEARDAG